MRQVGPPSPFESSDAAYSCTSTPAASSERLVCGLPVGDHDHAGADREHVAADRLVLVRIDRDAADAPFIEQLEQRHRRERFEDDREVVRDGRDHGEQVQHVPRPTIVGQITALERCALAREDVGQLTVRLGVRAIAATGRERVLVDPEEVAAVCPRGTGQAGRDRDARRLAGGGEALGLALPLRLRHLQDDRPGTRDEDRVVREHRIDEPVGRGHGDDLAAQVVEQLAEALVLALQEHADRARASRQRRNRPRAPATRRARGAASRSSSGRRTRCSWTSCRTHPRG